MHSTIFSREGKQKKIAVNLSIECAQGINKTGKQKENIFLAKRDIENLLKTLSISNIICSGFMSLQFIDLNHLIVYIPGDKIRMAYTGLNIIKFAMSPQTVARIRTDSTGGINCTSQSQAILIDSLQFQHFNLSIKIG